MIAVNHLSKIFRLYSSPLDRLKEIRRFLAAAQDYAVIAYKT